MRFIFKSIKENMTQYNEWITEFFRSNSKFQFILFLSFLLFLAINHTLLILWEFLLVKKIFIKAYFCIREREKSSFQLEFHTSNSITYINTSVCWTLWMLVFIKIMNNSTAIDARTHTRIYDIDITSIIHTENDTKRIKCSTELNHLFWAARRNKDDLFVSHFHRWCV